MCECSKTGCRSAVYLTVNEFRAIRAVPGRYVTVPGHLFDEAHERLVRVTDHYAIIEALDARFSTE